MSRNSLWHLSGAIIPLLLDLSVGSLEVSSFSACDNVQLPDSTGQYLVKSVFWHNSLYTFGGFTEPNPSRETSSQDINRLNIDYNTCNGDKITSSWSTVAQASHGFAARGGAPLVKAVNSPNGKDTLYMFVHHLQGQGPTLWKYIFETNTMIEDTGIVIPHEHKPDNKQQQQQQQQHGYQHGSDHHRDDKSSSSDDYKDSHRSHSHGEHGEYGPHGQHDQHAQDEHDEQHHPNHPHHPGHLAVCYDNINNFIFVMGGKEFIHVFDVSNDVLLTEDEMKQNGFIKPKQNSLTSRRGGQCVYDQVDKVIYYIGGHECKQDSKKDVIISYNINTMEWKQLTSKLMEDMDHIDMVTLDRDVYIVGNKAQSIQVFNLDSKQVSYATYDNTKVFLHTARWGASASMIDLNNEQRLLILGSHETSAEISTSGNDITSSNLISSLLSSLHSLTFTSISSSFISTFNTLSNTEILGGYDLLSYSLTNPITLVFVVFFIVVISLSLLYAVGRCTGYRVPFNYFKWLNQVFNFGTNLNLAIYLLASGEHYIYIGLAALLFILIPLVGNISLFVQLDMLLSGYAPYNERARILFHLHRIKLGLFVLLSGSVYETLSFASTGLFGWVCLSLGLTTTELQRFLGYRILFITLLQDIPQLLIALSFVASAGDDIHTTAGIFAMLTSASSIGILGLELLTGYHKDIIELNWTLYVEFKDTQKTQSYEFDVALRQNKLNTDGFGRTLSNYLSKMDEKNIGIREINIKRSLLMNGARPKCKIHGVFFLKIDNNDQDLKTNRDIPQLRRWTRDNPTKKPWSYTNYSVSRIGKKTYKSLLLTKTVMENLVETGNVRNVITDFFFKENRHKYRKQIKTAKLIYEPQDFTFGNQANPMELQRIHSQQSVDSRSAAGLGESDDNSRHHDHDESQSGVESDFDSQNRSNKNKNKNKTKDEDDGNRSESEKIVTVGSNAGDLRMLGSLSGGGQDEEEKMSVMITPAGPSSGSSGPSGPSGSQTGDVLNIENDVIVNKNKNKTKGGTKGNIEHSNVVNDDARAADEAINILSTQVKDNLGMKVDIKPPPPPTFRD